MIIKLKGADFSTNNINALLNNWFISLSLGSGATSSNTATSISKTAENKAYETVITIADGYEIGSAGVTVTMGGNAITPTISGNTITIAIAAVTGNVVIKVPTVNTSTGEEEEPGSGDTDVDAAAFIAAASITDTATQTKLDTLVKSLKSNNLWDKIDALYPCVGSTFEQMSYNLKDPTTFKTYAYTGTAPEVDSTGIKPTQLVVCDNYTTAPGQDFHTLVWDKDGYTTKHGLRIAICGVCSGEGLNDGGVQVQFYDNGTEGQAQIRTNGKDGRWNIKPCDVNPTGLVISSLTSGIIHNGVDLGAVKQGTPNFTAISGKLGINGMVSTDKPYLGHRGLVGFGKGLTIAEMQTYSQILNEFKNIY